MGKLSVIILGIALLFAPIAANAKSYEELITEVVAISKLRNNEFRINLIQSFGWKCKEVTESFRLDRIVSSKNKYLSSDRSFYALLSVEKVTCLGSKNKRDKREYYIRVNHRTGTASVCHKKECKPF